MPNTSYYLYQKWEQRGEQDWIPAFPNEYSIDGDGTMPLSAKTINDPACGYIPPSEPIYRWVNLDPSIDWVCDEAPTPVEPIYRWQDSGYTCVGYDKYQNSIKQVSYDSGATWQNVSPAEYSATTLIEQNSEYCGYVPPQPTFDGKFKATYSGGTTYSAACDGNVTLTSGNTRPNGYTYTAMTDAVIGDCVTSIGGKAFSGCTRLTSVTIPDSVTNIGRYAFQFCSSLTSVTIPDSLTYIDWYVFQSCTGLTSVTIPDSVTYIGNEAFQDCKSLTSITIPSGVTGISDYAFSDCISLTSATVSATTPPTLGDYAFYRTNNCPIYVPAASVDTYKAKNGWRNYASRIQAIPNS